MLDKNQLSLLELLKASLFGIEPLFQNNLYWDDVLAEAKAQSVVAIAAKSVPEEFGVKWRSSMFQSQAQFVRVLHEQAQLVSLFEQAGIPLAILKGTAAAVYYPEPDKRAMGDIDFIVPTDRFEEALNLMREHGYHLLKQGVRHTGFKKAGIEFELHHHFSYDNLEDENYIIEGLTHPENGIIGQYCFPMLPQLANGLVLLEHLRFHMKSGVGLRQIIDWMMYVEKVLNDEYWQSEFRQAAESRGLATLAITATRLCQRFLGLSERFKWCASVDDMLCERLLDFLFSSGNFGSKYDSGINVEIVSTQIRNMGLFHYLQLAGESNWVLYHQHEYLKPFCWLYQIIRVIKRGAVSKRGMRIVRDINHSKDRYMLFKELGII